MLQSLKNAIKKTDKKTDKDTEEMASQGRNNDPVRGMLANNDINNADIYDLQMTSKDQIQNVNTVVTQNNEAIRNLQTTVERIENSLSGNDRVSRQSSSIEGAILPNRVTKFHLRPADPKDIIPLLVEKNKIGYGAFGDVYKVKYKGQTVALKHINKQSHAGNITLVTLILHNQ